MKKPQLLRQHLVAAMPSLAADPERLLVFVDDGGLVASFTPVLPVPLYPRTDPA